MLMAAAMILTMTSCSNPNKSTPADEHAMPSYDMTSLGEERKIEFMAVNAYIYEAVPVEGRFDPPYEGTNAHIQLDVKALENDLGYVPGEWVPYLTIDYEITDGNNNSVAAGTLKPSATKAGPAYGANVSLEKGSTYDLRVTFHDPENNGYILQTDDRTGVSGKYWSEPINATWNGWSY